MRDPRLDRLADVLVRYSTAVKKGDLVTVVAEPGAMPAVEAIFEAVLRAGGHPSFHSRPENLQELKLRHGSDEQVRHECPFERHRLSACDVLVVLIHPVNTRFLGRMDPARVAMAQASRRGLITMSLQRKAAGRSRYVLTEIPSHAAAQDAEMSLTDYSDWVFRAGFLHLADPVEAWRTLRAQQERVRAHMQTTRTLRFSAPASDGSRGTRRHDGTDLTVDVSGRTWINHCGGENFPDGEVESGPRGVDGVVNYTFPAIYRGKEVDGIRLRFRAGRVVEATATKNEDYLIKLLDQDEGARTAGEVALGTNYHLTGHTRNTFFDEKIGGTFHIAVGAGYPESGNTNESALHWDMVSDLRPGGAFPGSPGGTIHADGELIQRDGRFVFNDWPGNESR
ncbi:MAG: aminopeptidase [Phycisphaerae bacterium]|nr:aminopeptidase [Phycisphaerae bacterium]